MKFSYRKKILLCNLSAALWALCGVFLLLKNPWLNQMATFFDDVVKGQYFQSAPFSGNDYAVVIVAIDEKSFDAFKNDPGFEEYRNVNWPWPPSLHAKLVEKLSQYGADRIGFDLLFSESFDRMYLPEYGSTKKLIEAKKKSDIPIALASKMDAGIYTPPLPEFLDAGFSSGLANMRGSFTDFVWRYHFQPFGTDSLALALAKMEGGEGSIAQYGWTSETLKNEQWITYRNIKGLGLPCISYSDVLIGSMPLTLRNRWGKRNIQTLFNGKAVLVGRTTLDSQDFRLTPIGQIPGVEVHATALQMLYEPHTMVIQELTIQSRFFVLIAAILFGFLFLRSCTTIVWIFLSFVLCGFYFLLSSYIFYHHRFFLPALEVFLVFYSYLVFANIFVALVEREEKDFIQGAFGKYLSPVVAKKLIENPDLVKLGGELREISILFSDIADFTTISEMMKPGDLIVLLNRYLTEMTREVLVRDGTLDKYIGDAIMAFWNAPYEQNDHALRACQAALAMQRKLAEFNRLQKTFEHPSIRCRIGINTGKAIVGNAGSLERFDYTAISDAVNTASRLEGLGKFYGVSIIIGGSTLRQIGSRFDTRILDKVTVKGKTEVTEIYELMGDAGTADPSFLEIHNQAMEAYFSRDWNKAMYLFEKKKLDFNDYHSTLFLKRIDEIMVDPELSESHNGVWVLTRK